MSLFDQIAESARAAHEVLFGDVADLTENGSTAPARVVLGAVMTESRTDDHGRPQRVSVRECRFPELDAVRHDATLNIGGEVWGIDSEGVRTASGFHCRLVRMQTYQVERERYRGRRS